MSTVFYDADPRGEVQSKKWSLRSPRHYLHCIQQAAARVNCQSEPHRPTLSAKGIYFTFRPSLTKILACPRFRTIFLAFGLPTQTDPRKRVLAWLRFFIMCLQAHEIVTMDDRTFRYLYRYRLIRKKLSRMAPLVDVEFFKTRREPDDFLLVVGDADRDEAVVAELSRSFDVTRVTTSPRVQSETNTDQSRITLRVAIDYDELIELYQKAAAVVMPISTNLHAAGTTTVTEALAAGCPVISNSISQWHDFKGNSQFSYMRTITVEAVSATLKQLPAVPSAADRSTLEAVDLDGGINFLAHLFARHMA